MGELRWGVSPVVRTVDAYNGESAIFVEATQLAVDRRFATRIVNEWCDFFAAGPSPITELGFVSRTPARLWNSLASLEELTPLELENTWRVFAQARDTPHARTRSSSSGSSTCSSP